MEIDKKTSLSEIIPVNWLAGSLIAFAECYNIIIQGGLPMIKKYIDLYGESFRLALRYPQFALLFVVMNLLTLAGYLKLPGALTQLSYVAGFLLKIFLLSAIGYITVRILRTGELPKKVLSLGIGRNWLVVLKFSLLQIGIQTVTTFLPLYFFASKLGLPPFGNTVWAWFMEYVFIFLIFEALFWEDRGLGYAYRSRNIYMLGRFEWIFFAYLLTKVPHVLVMLPGAAWLYTWPGILVYLAFLGMFDWVSNIYTFKVYGSDRLEVIEEVQQKIKEFDKGKK